MCCSAQLLGADRGLFFFFLTKEKYKSLFLWKSLKFLPVAAALRPPSLCYFLFILYFGMGFLSAGGSAGGGDGLPFLERTTPLPDQPSPGEPGGCFLVALPGRTYISAEAGLPPKQKLPAGTLLLQEESWAGSCRDGFGWFGSMLSICGTVLLGVLWAAAGRRMRTRHLHLRSFLSAAGLGGRALLRSQRGGDRGLPSSFLVPGFAPRLGEKQHEDLSVQQVPSGADFSPSQNPVPWLCAGLAVPCCPLALQTAPGQPRAVSVSSRNVPCVPQPGTEGW